MCTALNYTNGHHYIGRNLDWDFDFPNDVVVTPRNYPFQWRNGKTCTSHNALIGMAIIQNDYPLYFEAANDKGLGMVGTAFAGFAKYFPKAEGKDNVATFELIPYVLTQASTLQEARALFDNMNIWDIPFSEQQPTSPMHWIVGSKEGSFVVESTKDGLKVYDNNWGVLTNAPTFDWMSYNMANYVNLTRHEPTIQFAPDMKGIDLFSRGLGSSGLPGGVDSVSRFVRVAFTNLNSVCDLDPQKNVAQFFHILSNVQQVRGEAEIKPGVFEITQYACCIDTDTGIFYYSTYYNQSLTAVDMNKEDLEAKTLVSYPVLKEFQFHAQN
ncbi:choloylglycine hydrolase [uncultured Dubosiella sp.]|uniref:choloylglycine hydrolase n=1 Tax=uncultured Dubosiella sp. TaxID=1937011 RepID=UPI002587A556|nr:choloylglycine hydrolase [uncultured Dubosiella sp.]